VTWISTAEKAALMCARISPWKLMGFLPPCGKALQRTLARELKVELGSR